MIPAVAPEKFPRSVAAQLRRFQYANDQDSDRVEALVAGLLEHDVAEGDIVILAKRFAGQGWRLHPDGTIPAGNIKWECPI